LQRRWPSAWNVLSSRQEELARGFGAPLHPLIGAPGGIDVECGTRTGTPLLADSLASLECRLACRYEGGDRTRFVGEVLDGTLRLTADGHTPLVHGQGRFRRLAPA